jgi:hypothetical protein
MLHAARKEGFRATVIVIANESKKPSSPCREGGFFVVAGIGLAPSARSLMQ